MKKIYCILLFILTPYFAKATHIVGGEFQLDHLSDFDYRLTLNLYFDMINGNPAAEDSEALVHVYSKRNNSLIDAFVLPLTLRQELQFSNPACTSDQIQTRLLSYELDIRLSPSQYDDIEGYYVVWERCCRNETINNIFSPGDAGMTFYLEFPAVVRNGSQFINHTPDFSIPVGDFICLGSPFDFDFSATDSDGDRLQYSFTRPLNGNSSAPDPAPVPLPRPYSLVSWQAGFSTNFPIPHDPTEPSHAVNINSSGQISVTANQTGLFVFSVLCEEFRFINGSEVKIGEVRRDYQLMVIDCPVNEFPSIVEATYQDENGTPQIYTEGGTITVDASKDNLCFSVSVTDPDAPEVLTLSVRGINFTPRNNLISSSELTITESNVPKSFEVCWDECLFSEENPDGSLKPFVFDIIVRDDGCPEEGKDTIRIELISIPLINQKPRVFPENSVSVSSNQVDFTIDNVSQPYIEFEVFAEDIDAQDQLILYAEGVGFALEDLGMEFRSVTGLSPIQSTFKWQTDCRFITADRNEFLVNFIVEDNSKCDIKRDTSQVLIVINDKEIFLEKLLPANAFTPNGDGKNDVFLVDNLPEENCRFEFRKITIYNRWGNKVYESNSRDFSWDGKDYSTGMYYYTIDYKGRKFKGFLMLLK